jgi:hypothetical protein
MIAAKQVADLITWLRATLILIFPWLGLTRGSDGLTAAVILMIANWSADSIDGPIARRSRIRYQTWIGDHDLEVDMLTSCGLLAYMVASSYIPWQIGAIYLLIWSIIFWRLGLARVLGMLFQAPIYGWFIFIAVFNAPQVSLWLIAWVLLAIIVTWPKFPKVIVPNFLYGMREVFKNVLSSRHE